jgi:hypothetical protein
MHCILLQNRWKFFVLIDCPAASGAAETYTADERKMAVCLQQKATYVLGTGWQNQLLKCKGVVLVKMGGKQQEYSSSNDNRYTFKRLVMSCIRREQSDFQ